MNNKFGGQWRYHPDTGHIVAKSGQVIAFVARSAEEKHPELPALLTAAPELLNALVTLVQYKDAGLYTRETWDDARAVIARVMHLADAQS